MRPSKVLSVALLVLALTLTAILPGMAASTTKSLSTNFTLINLGDSAATGTISYVKPDGAAWKTTDDSFQISEPGGQAIFRQYLDGNLATGQGSAIVSSDQPMGAVVQILARTSPDTRGAYIGVSAGSAVQYVPLVIRKRVGASGLTNSQIIIQNTGSAATNITVKLVDPAGATTYTKTFSNLADGASQVYDLADESSANVPDAWYGSAVVSAATGGTVAVVSNLFTGSNGMQTFNAFSTPATDWLAPLFTSRLANGLSTPIAIQNLSGGTLAANAIQVTCKKNPNSPGQATVTIANTAAVLNFASFNINPVTDQTLPANWYGACSIHATGGVVAFVQMRKVGTDQAAAYEAIPASGTDKRVLVPMAAKQLDNGFATVTDIVNMSAGSAAHVKFTYIPSPEYVQAGGSSANVVINNVTINAGDLLQHNLRVSSGAGAVSQLPKGWYGTLLIESSDQPINAIVELTVLTGGGDTYQAHNAFTKP